MRRECSRNISPNSSRGSVPPFSLWHNRHQHNTNGNQRAMFAQRERGAHKSQQHSGINRMTDTPVRAGVDQFVAFLQSDGGAPVFSEVPPRPNGKGDSDDGKRQAEPADGRRCLDETCAQPAAAHSVVEHQNVRSRHKHDLDEALAARFALLHGLQFLRGDKPVDREK